jgi:oligoendopeptidase F
MVAALPRWDVTDVFTSIGSREYAAAREELGASLHRLTGLYDEHDVRGTDTDDHDPAAAPIPATAANAKAVDDVIAATNGVLDQVRRLVAYLSSFVSTDARDDLAQGELSQLQAELATLQLLRTRFDAWIARFDHDAITSASSQAADHAYPIEQSREKAAHQMSEAEEGLLADLQLTGSTAWQRLYQTFTSQIVVHVSGDDEPRSMSQVRGLAYHADAKVRRAAYEAELDAWEANAVPIVAALNAIKGESSTIHRRRGYADDLEPALAANSVDRDTLDAMQRAVVASFGDFRRYLQAKARLLGHDQAGLPFHDLFAPVAEGVARPWDAATRAVEDAFGTYSPRLAGLAKRAVDEQWIDAEPRNGKRDGAFCMGLDGDRSLVFVNYDGSFRSVQTLAHELGHAYHNVTLAGRTALQRQLPMALAETASIFCETVMVEAGLQAAAASATASDRLAVVEGDLSAACQVVVDIHSRFLFESAFFEARRKRTLSVKETCALMLDAQEATYGDGLDAGARHPYMWAAKPHYYGRTFYNWPYTFGLLFGLGLYARYQEDPERFRDGYDDLLSSCGLASARDLAARFGIDVADEAFWTASLDVVRRRIDEFVALAAG